MKSILSVILLINTTLCAQITYPEKDWIQQLQRYTISIGDLQTDTVVEKNKKIAKQYYNIIGTGLVCYVKYKNHVIPVVVTAKHVLKTPQNYLLDSIRVRFSWHDDKSVYEYFGISIPLLRDHEINFFPHPDSSIDLACFALRTDSPVMDSVSLMTYSYFPDDYQIFEGAQVYVLGYPGSVGKNYWTRALLRRSIISWVPHELGKEKFLIDCNVFPGNSGGPVFSIKPEFPVLADTSDYMKVYKFLGIVIERRFNYNKVQLLKNGQLNPVTDTQGFGIFSLESIGVGVVEPAKNVHSLLEAYQKMINKE